MKKYFSGSNRLVFFAGPDYQSEREPTVSEAQELSPEQLTVRRDRLVNEIRELAHKYLNDKDALLAELARRSLAEAEAEAQKDTAEIRKETISKLEEILKRFENR